MKQIFIFFSIGIIAVSLVESCTSIQGKEVTLKNYLSKKKLISCMPGATAGEEWLVEFPDGIPALQGWGNYQWKVSTPNDSAQFYFNQGINMYYSYHMIEAYGSFAKATKFDPSLAIAYWGQALSIGPNINYPDVTMASNKEALELIGKAKANIAGASVFEKQLVDAIENRYSTDSLVPRDKINNGYALAMKSVYDNNPSNGEAFALYADALMVEHPWDLYEQNETPKSWTPPMVTVIEKGLEKFPMHPGLNHYYIHVVEASSMPGKALPSARLLSGLMPQVAHMVHMPSHIFIRTGNYRQGIDVNTSSINGFRNYSQQYPPVEELKPLYLSHNEHMMVACALMSGESKLAASTAAETQKNIPLSHLENPSAFGNYLQSMHMLPTVVALRFGQWQQLVQSSLVDPSIDFEYAFQLFAKGMAFSHTRNLKEAKNYLKSLQEKMKTPVLHNKYASFANSASLVLDVAEQVLQGTIAMAEKKGPDAISFFQKAVTIEDAMMYGEPKDWLIPARHYLGNALIKMKRYSEAQEVFVKDLYINPANSWALAGLMLAQKGLNNSEALLKTTSDFEKASAGTDIKISASVIE
jgi:tetratricopeptide (TPR) repeat protein